MKLPNKVYDVLKYVCLIFAPALITLISTIFALYHIDGAEVVCGTIAAIATFVGALIGISSINYNKGDKLNGK
jgi:polyferredoxin